MDSSEKHLLAKIGQYILISNDEGHVLMLERRRSKNWTLPGGRMDKDDADPIAALIREIKEEIGVTVSDVRPFDIKLIEDQWQVKYCVYFLATYNDRSSITISDEHTGSKFISSSELSSVQLDEEPYLREVLDNFFSKQ